MEKVLITGGAGYVGSCLVSLLLNNNYSVTVIDNLLLRQNITHFFKYFHLPTFTFIRGDIRNRKLMNDLLSETDYFIHLAAIVGYPACKLNPTLAKMVNAQASLDISDLITDQKVIYASTGSVYGSVEGICTEETPTKPLSLYGETKYIAERAFVDKNNGVALRFATAFGLSPRLRLDLLINDFVYQALKTKHLVVYERKFRRTLIHVQDMALSYLFTLQNFDKMAGECYNVGSETLNYSKEQICETIRRKFDFYLHYADFGKDPDKRDYEVSYQKISNLGFKTTISLEEGIDELIKGFRNFEISNPYSSVHAIGGMT